jgi:PAS domain S-box-containing protein
MFDFMQKLPGVIYEYRIRQDGSKSFTFISKNCYDILGVSCEALMQDASILKNIILEEDRSSFEASSSESHRQHTDWNWEGRILVNGITRWIEARSNVEVLDGYVNRKGIILDISERKRREQETELRYESLVQHLPLGVGVHVGGKLVFANRYAYQIMGAKPNELIGKSVLDMVHPDYQHAVIERIAKVAVGESLPLMEEKFIRADGSVIDVETGAIPFTYNGKPANQIIVRDISDRKQAEAISKRNETLFTQLFNSVPIGVVMLNNQGKVEQVNKGFREMFGYDLDVLKGQNLNDFIVPDELRNEGIDLNNIIAANKVINVSTKRKHRDGHQVEVLLYGVPVILGGSTIGIYGVYVDITDRKKVEEELKVRNAELDNFVYKVSHDLRAPLSSILGLVNLAKLPDNDDNPMDYINIIGQKVADLDHFISDVLSHSKNLKMELTLAKVDFNTIISRTFTDLNYLEGASDVIVYRKVNGSDFYSDPWRVSEIFRNLVSNAIKYRQPLSAHPEVRIEIDTFDQYSEIKFSDNGIGIDGNNLPKIFEMFYRATEQSSGSGIGLYIVKNAVEKLAGKILVKSEVGVGTTFTIILPNRIAEVSIGKVAHPMLQRHEND